MVTDFGDGRRDPENVDIDEIEEEANCIRANDI